MPDVVNNALGLAQYICCGRSEDFAVAYLQSIERLSHVDWKEAKSLLVAADQTNRRTKEATIADIVYTLKNEPVTTDYLVKDLSLCPGLSKEALELVDFSVATLFSVRQDITRISSRSRDISQHHSTHSTSINQQAAAGVFAAPNNTTTSAQEINTTDFPYLPQSTSNSPLPPSSGSWSSNKSNNVYKAQKQQQNKKNKPQAVHGTGIPVNSNISHAYKPVCLGLRSGSDETTESLTNEFKQWTHIKDLVVEPVRQSSHSTMFRVQYKTPVSLELQWKNPAVWPSRITASQWRGNPKLPLKPLAERIHTKRIYIGNLSSTVTLTTVKENMMKIYQKEIEDNVIQDIQVFWNQAAQDREEKMKSQNPSHVIMQSACIVLISQKGTSLAEVSLKNNSNEHYQETIRRTVRTWNGAIPRPKTSPKVNLMW